MAVVTRSLVVFTALDGPLRDLRTHTCGPARQAVAVLADQAIPLVLVTDHPASEVFDVLTELRVRHPFICDNGTSVYVPRGYFAEMNRLGQPCGEWDVIPFHDASGGEQAVRLLVALYKSCFDDAVVVGLGDRPDHCALLSQVDVPVIVRSEAVEQDQLVRGVPAAYVTKASGPAGWTEAILGSVADEA